MVTRSITGPNGGHFNFNRTNGRASAQGMGSRGATFSAQWGGGTTTAHATGRHGGQASFHRSGGVANLDASGPRGAALNAQRTISPDGSASAHGTLTTRGGDTFAFSRHNDGQGNRSTNITGSNGAHFNSSWSRTEDGWKVSAAGRAPMG
ncbi:MAG: hypothetical protein AAFV29_22790 [Myxococcota bacterium]